MKSSSVENCILSWEGCISRKQYWKIKCIIFFFTIFVTFIFWLSGKTDDSILHIIICTIWYFILILLSIFSQIRRWHDRGKSGRWVLLNLIPIVGTIWVFIETWFLKGKINSIYR